MKNILLLFIIVSCSLVKAQEAPEKEVLDSLIEVIEKSHSNLGAESKVNVGKPDYKSLILDFSSSVKTTVSHIEESFSINLREVVDTYQIPSQDGGVTVIVNLKTKVLITKKNTEYENLFHDEIISEDLREVSDIWFNFAKDTDAHQFETLLSKFKK